MSRRSRRGAAAAAAFPALSEGTQNGLRRLVSDNLRTVASMLDVALDGNTSINDSSSVIHQLCEKCAQVMKQQQLSASSFLARFFHDSILSEHAIQVLKKSGKGSAATLGDRIAAQWAKDIPMLLVVAELSPGMESKNDAEKDTEKERNDDEATKYDVQKNPTNRKRREADVLEGKIPKKDKKTKD